MQILRRRWFQIFVSGLLLLFLVEWTLVATGDPNYVPSAILLGAFLVPVTFVTYLYERLPNWDVPLPPVAICFIWGGVLGTVVAGTLEYDLMRTLGFLPKVGVVHIQYRFRVRRYSGNHETSNLRPFTFGHRKRAVGNRAALQGRFHHAPSPDPPRQHQGRTRPADSPLPRMRLANGARRHPRLQRAGPRRSGGRLLAPQANPRRLRRGERRSPAGDAPPLSEGVRARDEPVDLGDGRRGRLRGEAHRQAGLGETIRATLSRLLGSDAGCGPSGGSPPQTPCTKEKKEARPADGGGRCRPSTGRWASRTNAGGAGWPCPPSVASPRRSKPHRLVQRSVAKDDPDPKAISCYGLYLPGLGDTWLRFVDGRPVSSITTQFLSWCLREARSGGQEGPAAHLGQRQLACLQRGEALAREAQPPRQKERRAG